MLRHDADGEVGLAMLCIGTCSLALGILSLAVMVGVVFGAWAGWLAACCAFLGFAAACLCSVGRDD